MTAGDENTRTVKKRAPGRPKKGIKRSGMLMVRLTPTERLLIEDKSRKAGMKPSEWFRKSAKNAKVTPCFSTEETGWLRMLAGLANNLNQLTRLTHIQGLLSLSGKCREMLKLINEVLTKIKSHGR